MKMTLKQLNVFRGIQEVALLVVILTFVAYDFGFLSRMTTHLFWMAELVIYYAIDLLVGILFNKNS